MFSYRPVCEFFKRWINVFDFVVVFLCLAVQILWLSLPHDHEMRHQEWLDSFLIVLRYSARFLVMCFLFWHQKQQRRRMRAVAKPVIFDNLSGGTGSHKSKSVK